MLDPSLLPFHINYLPPDAYLVGGTVRDTLLHRFRPKLDLDFVIPHQAIQVAKKIAHDYQAGFVVLDEVHHIARVVFPTGTVDIAQQEGDSLEDDLNRRDFTINAIAYNFHTQKLIDPLQGYLDIQKKQLKMVKVSNLIDDPLRLLRAYRQAAQLDFTIEINTRNTIIKLAHKITQVATERVKAELDYLLAAGVKGTNWIIAAIEEGVLGMWLKGDHRLLLVKIDKLKLDYIPQEHIQTAKLACLCSWELPKMQQELLSLKYTRIQMRQITKALKNLDKLSQSLSLREQYFLFQEVKDAFPVMGIIGLALEKNQDIIEKWLQSYYNPQDPVAHPKPLVTGDTLIEYLHLKAGPKIAYLLTEIQVAHIEGRINTPQEALEWAMLINNS